MREFPHAALSEQGSDRGDAGENAMSDSVASIASSVAAIPAARSIDGAPASMAQTSGSDTAATPAQPSVRLHIEVNGEGGYVYQIMDSLTGLLLAEIERSQIKSFDPSSYVAGSIISTKA